MRTIDPEHNWFWQEGYRDGFAGERADAPDEARRLSEHSDYHAGYEAGTEDRAAADKLRIHQRDAITALMHDVLEADDARIAQVLREQGLEE